MFCINSKEKEQRLKSRNSFLNTKTKRNQYKKPILDKWINFKLYGKTLGTWGEVYPSTISKKNYTNFLKYPE